MPAGRPSTYNLEIATSICERIADGESLLQLCQEEGFPDRHTIRKWRAQFPEFDAMYADAKKHQAEYYADAILHEAYAAEETNVGSRRLRIDALKWQASKLDPKRWADNVRHTGADGAGPVQVDVTAKTQIVDALLSSLTDNEKGPGE